MVNSVRGIEMDGTLETILYSSVVGIIGRLDITTYKIGGKCIVLISREFSSTEPKVMKSKEVEWIKLNHHLCLTHPYNLSMEAEELLLLILNLIYCNRWSSVVTFCSLAPIFFFKNLFCRMEILI